MKPKPPISSDDPDRASGKGVVRPVTVLATRRVEAGREREFEAFLDRLGKLIASFPGHQGFTSVRPPASSREYVVVYRFDSMDHLQAWRRSPARQSMIAESADLAEAPPEERETSGMETWFAVPGDRVVHPPARWKMWLLTLCAIYPIITLITVVAGPLLTHLPQPARFAIIVPVLGALMTWVVMPALSRLFARWLYP